MTTEKTPIEKTPVERKVISVLPDTKERFDELVKKLKPLARYSHDVSCDRVMILLLDTYQLLQATQAASDRPGFEDE
jgi:hypothetical protein